MRTKISILIIVALSLVQSTKAQEVWQLTLSKARELAATQNTAVRNANYDIAIARKQVWETTAQGLPQMNASLGYNNNLDLPVTLVPAKMFNPQAGDDEFIEMKFGVQHNVKFDFQITQLVFNGSYIVGLQTAKTFKQLSEQSKSREINEVLTTVSQTYNTILFAQKNKLILKSTFADIKQTYEELKKTYEAGLAEKTAVDQLKLNMLTVANAIKSIDRQIDVQYDLLKIQTGIDINDSLVLNDSLELVFQNAQIERALLQPFKLEKNIDYRLMKTQEEISKQQLNLEKSTLLPSINAFFSHSESGQSNEFSFFDADQTWYPANIIGAKLIIPITTSGGSISRIQQAQLKLQKTKNNRALLEQNLRLQINMARNKLRNEYDRYLTEKQNVSLAENIYRQSLKKFKQGLISSTELTQVNTQYFNSQSAYYSAMLNVLNAKAELDKLIGNNL